MRITLTDLFFTNKIKEMDLGVGSVVYGPRICAQIQISLYRGMEDSPLGGMLGLWGIRVYNSRMRYDYLIELLRVALIKFPTLVCQVIPDCMNSSDSQGNARLQQC